MSLGNLFSAIGNSTPSYATNTLPVYRGNQTPISPPTAPLTPDPAGAGRPTTALPEMYGGSVYNGGTPQQHQAAPTASVNGQMDFGALLQQMQEGQLASLTQLLDSTKTRGSKIVRKDMSGNQLPASEARGLNAYYENNPHMKEVRDWDRGQAVIDGLKFRGVGGTQARRIAHGAGLGGF